MPVEHSSSTSPHEMQDDRLPLYRVAFEGERTAHWALFVPEQIGGHKGTLVHVGVEKEARCGSNRTSGPEDNRKSIRGCNLASNHTGKVEKYALECHNFKMRGSGAESCFPIANAFVTLPQLRRAAEEVFKRKSYNLLTNNCQHFCIDVVTYLHQIYPQSVPRSAVDDVLARAQGLTNISYMLRRTQLHEEGTDEESDRGDRPRFSID
uniref:PPPDE domain-containing protein n=1 Tax=Photinus pyralis TaxID=7054 RepID=A0A1Y1MAD1_PHOPY